MTATRKIAPTIRGWVPALLSGGPIRGFHRSLMYAAMVVVVSTIAAGCTDSDEGQMRRPSTGGDGVIVVGVSGAFAENQIVAEMYAQVLEDAGYTVERRLDLRSREVSQNALEAGAIDVKPEYLSSLLLFLDPGGVRGCRRCCPADRPAAPVQRAHVAHTITGRGHQSVRGERGDGPAVRPDHGELPRRRRRPADVRRATGMPPTAALPPGIARGLRDHLRRLHAAGRGRARPSTRSGATRCRSGCCSPRTRASNRTGSSHSLTTSASRTRRTSRP